MLDIDLMRDRYTLFNRDKSAVTIFTFTMEANNDEFKLNTYGEMELSYGYNRSLYVCDDISVHMVNVSDTLIIHNDFKTNDTYECLTKLDYVDDGKIAITNYMTNTSKLLNGTVKTKINTVNTEIDIEENKAMKVIIIYPHNLLPPLIRIYDVDKADEILLWQYTDTNCIFNSYHVNVDTDVETITTDKKVYNNIPTLKFDTDPSINSYFRSVSGDHYDNGVYHNDTINLIYDNDTITIGDSIFKSDVCDKCVNPVNITHENEEYIDNIKNMLDEMMNDDYGDVIYSILTDDSGDYMLIRDALKGDKPPFTVILNNGIGIIRFKGIEGQEYLAVINFKDQELITSFVFSKLKQGEYQSNLARYNDIKSTNFMYNFRDEIELPSNPVECIINFHSHVLHHIPFIYTENTFGNVMMDKDLNVTYDGNYSLVDDNDVSKNYVFVRGAIGELVKLYI